MALSKIKRTREVTKSSGGKHIEISKYNPMTGKGTFKEKDIEYKANGSPRIKFVEKQVVKRDKDLNWKSSKESKKLVVGGKKAKSTSDFTTYKMGGMTTLKKSPRVTVNAGGEKHVVYKKTTKKGEGKVGNIMVNHPTKDKGQWDTIDLTAKGRANTIAQGVAATKKWHKDNPDYMYKGNKKATGRAQQAAIAIAMKKAGKAPKMKSGGATPAWTRKEGKNPAGGLNAKGVASYRAANPGSKLKTAVTTKPSKIKPGSEAAGRRKSFCSRMSGVKKKLTSAKTANDPNSRINKSLRKWNC